MYDTIIIGGGISGLYCAIHLSNVLVLEESNELGGRIKKHYHPQYEIGSGRFHKKHKLLWNLIEKFNLTPQPMPKSFVLETNHKILSVEDYLLHMIHLWTRNDMVHHKSFFDICASVLGEADALHFMYAQGYHEIYFHNAHNSLHSFHQDYCQEDYYVIKEGLQEICLRMMKEIKGTCVFNHSVKSITQTDGFIKVDHYEGKKVIVTIPPSLFYLFPILSPYMSLVSTLVGPPLLRIYVKYPTPAWFESIDLEEQTEHLKHLIPMRDGIIMMVYMKEEEIMKFTYKNELKLEGILVSQIQFELETLLPSVKIQKPIWIKPYLWKGGVHNWVPSNVPAFPTIKNVFVCGDAFSTRPYWIEGALESASCMMHTCINK